MKLSSVVSLLAFVAAAVAAPSLDSREETPDVTPTVSICIFNGSGCIAVPVTGPDCIDLDGGLTILNQDVGKVTIPSGFICNFFPAFGCSSAASTAILSPTPQLVSPGFPDFSSFLCSPL